MSGDWADQDLRHTKRRLSVYEKSDLTPSSNVSKALVMPGSPGTEIEELVNRGFFPPNIYGIEEDPETAHHLYEHYWERSPIHLEEVGAWLTRCSTEFDYIHLDYCGMLKISLITSLQQAMGSLAPVSRLRVSVFGSRRPETSLKLEQDIQKQVLHLLLEEISKDPYFKTDAKALLTSINDSTILTDSSVTLAALFLANYFFGYCWEDFSDQILTTGIPVSPSGTHRISSIRRKRYCESHGNNIMFTAWVDLVRLPHFETCHSEQWMKREILQVISLLTSPSVNYVELSLDDYEEQPNE